MNSYTTPTTHTAQRKTSMCTICAGTIHIGQRYEKWRSFGGDVPGTLKAHLDCIALFRDYGVNEWSEGDTLSDLLTDIAKADAREQLAKFEDRALAATMLEWLEPYWAEDTT